MHLTKGSVFTETSKVKIGQIIYFHIKIIRTEISWYISKKEPQSFGVLIMSKIIFKPLINPEMKILNIVD